MTDAQLFRQLYATDPVGFAREVLGFEPDETQARILDPGIRKGILCCTRGFGKTETIAVLAAWHFAVQERALIVVLSETAEKAAELVERVRGYLTRAEIPFAADRLRWRGLAGENGSRILPVPARGGSLRGHPATMILVDEAAVVPDKLWVALSGTRASTSARCRVWLMSTPGARRGFFYENFVSGDPSWARFKVAAPDCPRIRPEFLEEMRQEMLPDDFNREFLAEFGEPRSQLFADDDQLKCVSAAEEPLTMPGDERRRVPQRFLGERVLLATDEWVDRNGFLVAADLGQARDHSAVAALEYRFTPLGWKDPMTLVPAYGVEYVLKWLERVPLRTTYTDLAAILVDLVRHPEVDGRASLVLDAGGVGRAFLDHLRALRTGVSIVPVQLTGGLHVTHERGFLNVPKPEPVLALEQVFREGRLKVPTRLPGWRLLQQELRGFERRRSGTGRMTYTGKTADGGTDDLVIAVALAVWVAGKKLRTAGGPDGEYRAWRAAMGRRG